MKKQYGLLLLVLLVSLTTVLAGCGGSNAGQGSGANAGTNEAGGTEANADGQAGGEAVENAEPFTVSLRHIQIGDAKKFRKAILDDAIAKAEAEVPGLAFELDGVEDEVNRFTKLPAEMAAGNPPKIFDLFGGEGDALKYADAGRLLDLTPILEELGLADKFLNMGQFTLDGKVYGLPIGGSTEGFFYNKKLFAEYGIEVPTSLEELEQAAETLKANGVTPIAMGSQAAWVPLMLANTLIGRYAGPEAINGFRDGSAAWDSPEVVAAFAKYQEWVDNGYFTKGELGVTYDAMLNEFLAGKAGMMFDGSWRASAFTNPDLVKEITSEDVGYFAMPAVPGGKGDQTAVNGNYSNGYGFSSNLNERELAAVKAFIKHLYNDEMQVRGLLEDALLPSMKLSDPAASEIDTKLEDPVVKQIMETMNAAGEAFSHFDSVVQSDVYSETEQQIQRLIAGRATPQEVGDVLQQAQEAANAK
ncbi:extracellular solute-binding protein [Xylanibacillus composti]|uniref:Extracellular solute-binding protein n=1 Tax=Xylanibacillus composti TaxID=1572762 RepID=A0A8J4H5B3_9BACL|nr:extracellular solute-binding protein [Xylanibacillus composti]MDT9726488.1 extracellular solute-binding protein [Xylanibacillus composti]GIQ69941.1 hypothetical protein XYCOK13_27650 [Xylanibacillus composti]